MKIKKKIGLSVIFFLFSPFILFAQEYVIGERDAYIEEYLNTVSKLSSQEYIAAEKVTFGSEERVNVIEKTLRNLNIELTLEYLVFTYGKQIFEVVDSQGSRISRLNYPHRGEMYIFKGQVCLIPRLSIGGRYGSSNFKKTTCIDTDWIPTIDRDLVWWESNSDTKPEVRIYDLNLYYRLLDYDEEGEGGSGEKNLFKDWRADKISLDIFAGYQKQEGRYNMINLVDTVENYQSVSIPYKGLDAFYKIKYQGPRLGLRAEGSYDKITTKLSFAYAWLETDAFGWWNMRKYSFWQTGKNGVGLTFELELTYNFTPHLSAGLGYNYISLEQKNLTETGIFDTSPGNNYQDLDIIRNANSKIFGPSLILKYLW